jgi:uncharacterized protein (DUF427 family)
VVGLTRTDGPLSPTAPKTVNYDIDGPAHKLLMHPFPRRVRAEIAGRTVLDTRDGMLLHETGLLPVLYAPLTDFDRTVLESSTHTTHCPFKGDASYFHLRTEDGLIENAVWSYETPFEQAGRIKGYLAFYSSRVDRIDQTS